MIYSFGCSFSTNYMVPLENFWLDILAKKIGHEYESWGNGGTEMHEAFHRLTWSMRDFKKGDIIIYQFTEHHRIGLRHNNYYISTSSLKHKTSKEVLDTIHFLRETVNINKTDEEYLTLLEFSNTWMDGQMFWNYWRVWNLLKYLEDKIGIKFILLFLDQTWANVIPKEHYTNIPIFKIPNNIQTDKWSSSPDTNIALDLFCSENKWAIKDDLKYKNHPDWHSGDGHPGDLGHLGIANTLIKHINENN